MNRKAFLLFVCIFILSAIEAPLFGAQSTPTKEAICKIYADKVKQIHQIPLHITLKVRRWQAQEVTKELIPELETIFSVPVEDPIYQENNPLFINGVSEFEWNFILDGEKMFGVQKIVGVYNKLINWNPIITPQGGPSLKELDTKQQQEFRFTIYPLGSKQQADVMHYIVPVDLAPWYYAPSMWYPPLDQIGMPANFDKVELRIQSMQPYALIFTPEKMDANMMAYLAKACRNPNLTPQDLTCLLQLDPETYACKSFVIINKDGGEELYRIHLMSHSPFREGLMIPSAVRITTSESAEKEGKPVWGLTNTIQMETIVIEKYNP